MKFLLDTCIISEMMARRPNQAVIQWIESIAEDRLYLSVITIGEIRKGIAKLADSTREAGTARVAQRSSAEPL